MSGYSVFLCELLSVVIVVKRLGGRGGEERGGEGRGKSAVLQIVK